MTATRRPGRRRLFVEEPDFGMWPNDADPVWSAHPRGLTKTVLETALNEEMTEPLRYEKPARQVSADGKGLATPACVAEV